MKGLYLNKPDYGLFYKSWSKYASLDFKLPAIDSNY